MATILWLSTTPGSERPDKKSRLYLTKGRHFANVAKMYKKPKSLRVEISPKKFDRRPPNPFVPCVPPNRKSLQEKSRTNSFRGRRKSKNNFEFSRSRSNDLKIVPFRHETSHDDRTATNRIANDDSIRLVQSHVEIREFST